MPRSRQVPAHAGGKVDNLWEANSMILNCFRNMHQIYFVVPIGYTYNQLWTGKDLNRSNRLRRPSGKEWKRMTRPGMTDLKLLNLREIGRFGVVIKTTAPEIL